MAKRRASERERVCQVASTVASQVQLDSSRQRPRSIASALDEPLSASLALPASQGPLKSSPFPERPLRNSTCHRTACETTRAAAAGRPCATLAGTKRASAARLPPTAVPPHPPAVRRRLLPLMSVPPGSDGSRCPQATQLISVKAEASFEGPGPEVASVPQTRKPLDQPFRSAVTTHPDALLCSACAPSASKRPPSAGPSRQARSRAQERTRHCALEQ